MMQGTHYRNSKGGNTLDKTNNAPAAVLPGLLYMLHEGTPFMLDGRERMLLKVVKQLPEKKSSIVTYEDR